MARVVEIDTNGMMAVVAPHPLAGGIGRAAEILTQQFGRALAQFVPGLLDKVDFSLGILH